MPTAMPHAPQRVLHGDTQILNPRDLVEGLVVRLHISDGGEMQVFESVLERVGLTEDQFKFFGRRWSFSAAELGLAPFGEQGGGGWHPTNWVEHATA